MGTRYVIIHFWATFGGFHKRIEMLVDVLCKRGSVQRVKTQAAFIRFLTKRDVPEKSVYALVYTSLVAPHVLALRLLRPGIPVYYMIRGDEVTYVKHARRHFRAFVAIVFQKLMNALGCHFIFVCEDLRVLFEKRLGPIRKSGVLPNTLGKRLPATRHFDGRIGLIGDFGTVKNIEWTIEQLRNHMFEVHLFGNRTLPEKWQRPWLHAHGIVDDLPSCLRSDCSLVVLTDATAGFPNVMVEALEAGCGVAVHTEFPFAYFPVADQWRFSLNSFDHGNFNSEKERESSLESVLGRLLREKRDFKRDNEELISLIESNWEKRVWEIFA